MKALDTNNAKHFSLSIRLLEETLTDDSLVYAVAVGRAVFNCLSKEAAESLYRTLTDDSLSLSDHVH